MRVVHLLKFVLTPRAFILEIVPCLIPRSLLYLLWSALTKGGLLVSWSFHHDLWHIQWSTPHLHTFLYCLSLPMVILVDLSLDLFLDGGAPLCMGIFSALGWHLEVVDSSLWCSVPLIFTPWHIY